MVLQLGVMFAASIWSLIIPSIDMEIEHGKVGWIPATIGIILGVSILLLIDSLFQKYMNKNNIVGESKKNKILNLAITLHNIPEGMAVRYCVCVKLFWRLWHENNGCYDTFNRNCNSKLSRGYGNIFTI